MGLVSMVTVSGSLTNRLEAKILVIILFGSALFSSYYSPQKYLKNLNRIEWFTEVAIFYVGFLLLYCNISEAST